MMGDEAEKKSNENECPKKLPMHEIVSKFFTEYNREFDVCRSPWYHCRISEINDELKTICGYKIQFDNDWRKFEKKLAHIIDKHADEVGKMHAEFSKGSQRFQTDEEYADNNMR